MLVEHEAARMKPVVFLLLYRNVRLSMFKDFNIALYFNISRIHHMNLNIGQQGNNKYMILNANLLK